MDKLTKMSEAEEIMDDSICIICYDRYNDAEQSSRGKKKNIYGEFQNDTM